MLVQINPSDPRPMYLQIMDEIHRALVTGALSADDPLPSVRELSGRLGVNPNTVKQAYRELEHEGVIYARQGLGTFVANGASSRVGRERLMRQVARQALREAYRSGIRKDELIEAIRQEDEPDEEPSPGKEKAS